ncbi:hypothetical protein QEM15_003756 [Pseudomonas putida]|nr:hypothetical protein [Pseudomonas putida]
MSWLDGFDDADSINLDNRIQRTDKLPEPGWFTGSATPLFEGIGHGATQLALQVAEYGNDPTQIIALDIPTDEEEWARREQIGEARRELGKEMQPDPRAVGVVGQALFGFGDFGARMGIGALTGIPYAGAATVGLSMGEGTYSELRSQGVDRPTAAGAGALQGLTASVTAAIPAARFVASPIADYGIAVGANQVLDISSKAATAALLESGGYSAQAAQYQALDAKSSLANLIFTSAFFALGRRGGPRPTQEQVDAGLAQKEIDHFEDGAAPGAPVDPASASMHREQLSQAISQLDRGEPVTVIDGFKGDFLRRPPRPEAIGPNREEALAMARQELEPVVRQELEQDAAGVLPNVADIRTELGGLQRTLEGLDATYRDRAKQFQTDGLSRKRAETQAKQAIETERQQLTDRVTTLEESLQANRTGELARGELAAMGRGETPARMQLRIEERAGQIIQGFERTRLAAQVEAARTPEQAMDGDIDSLLDGLGYGTRAKDLSPDVAQPDATPAQRTATPLAESVPTAAKTATGLADDGTSSAKSEIADVSPEGPKLSPEASAELEVLRQSVAQRPDAVINSGFDADGNPTQIRAADALAEVEAEYQAGVKESRSFMAAITCLLRS